MEDHADNVTTYRYGEALGLPGLSIGATHYLPRGVRKTDYAKKGYFDSTRVHRVVPDFVIQDGDPTGTGGGGPGYTIRCEYNQLRYEAGMVGMALSGKDTGGSQWFITHSPQPHLDARYTVFGHVVAGIEIVDRAQPWDVVRRVQIWDGTTLR